MKVSPKHKKSVRNWRAHLTDDELQFIRAADAAWAVWLTYRADVRRIQQLALKRALYHERRQKVRKAS